MRSLLTARQGRPATEQTLGASGSPANSPDGGGSLGARAQGSHVQTVLKLYFEILYTFKPFFQNICTMEYVFYLSSKMCIF